MSPTYAGAGIASLEKKVKEIANKLQRHIFKGASRPVKLLQEENAAIVRHLEGGESKTEIETVLMLGKSLRRRRDPAPHFVAYAQRTSISGVTCLLLNVL